MGSASTKQDGSRPQQRQSREPLVVTPGEPDAEVKRDDSHQRSRESRTSETLAGCRAGSEDRGVGVGHEQVDDQLPGLVGDVRTPATVASLNGGTPGGQLLALRPA
ncbi:MAG: hypothetical protein V9F00_17665 [Nocardioides sp.]